MNCTLEQRILMQIMMLSSIIQHCRSPVRRFSTAAGIPAASNAIATDMTLRALLRNLKLLDGMRKKETFDVIVTGLEAKGIAAAMSRLEPNINFQVGADSRGADVDIIDKNLGKNIDSVIIVQPYHVLQSKDIISKVHDCLVSDEGTLGLIWTRPVTENWVEKYQQFAQPQGLDSNLLPQLEESEFVLDWLERYLDFEGNKFAPLKHRKYINTLEGNPRDLATLLPFISDARIPLIDAQDAVAAGLDAVGKWNQEHDEEMKTIQGRSDADTRRLKALSKKKKDLNLNLHIFHTQVLPESK